MRKLLQYGAILGMLSACTFDNTPKLPSVEERETEAIGNLRDLLVAPASGWRIDYRPTSGTGSAFILLNFDEDGTVRIQSDVAANNGQFRDQTIPYRLDNAQGLELIFETYVVFSYLFELDQATFGGEFEFIFVEEEGNNLIFVSKTDVGERTTIQFEPSSPSDAALLSPEAFSQLGRGIFQQEDLGGVGLFATYNIFVEANNHTISSTINLDRRVIKLHGIAQGQNINEIITNDNGNSINREMTFGIRDEVIILDQPINTTLDGISYAISQIPVQNFNQFIDSFCAGQQDSIASFNTDATPSLGDITMSSSLFQTHTLFQPGPNTFFSINYPFLYDENDQSISEDIEAVFPQAAAFQWYYGLELAQDSLLNAVGFVTVDEFNNAEFYLRVFDYVQDGNRIQLTFTGDFFITDDNVTQEQRDGLVALTDQIFGGGEVFILEVITIEGLFEFFNPCNRYKGFLL